METGVTAGGSAAAKREYGYDLLRVIAACAVILMHICAMDWYSLPVSSGK